MKKYLLFIVLVIFVFVNSGLISCAPKVVAVRPAGTVTRVDGPGPSTHHVWVRESWVWRHGHYVRVPGYWITPPRNYHFWADGHWKNKRHGWVWVPGHWR